MEIWDQTSWRCYASNCLFTAICGPGSIILSSLRRYRLRCQNSWPCSLPKWMNDLDSRSNLTFQRQCNYDISEGRT